MFKRLILFLNLHREFEKLSLIARHFFELWELVNRSEKAVMDFEGTWDDHFILVCTNEENGQMIIKPKTSRAIWTAGYRLKNCLRNEDHFGYYKDYLYFLVDKKYNFKVSIFLNAVDFDNKALYITSKSTELKGPCNYEVEEKYFKTLYLLADELSYHRETLKSYIDLSNRSVRNQVYDIA